MTWTKPAASGSPVTSTVTSLLSLKLASPVNNSEVSAHQRSCSGRSLFRRAACSDAKRARAMKRPSSVTPAVEPSQPLAPGRAPGPTGRRRPGPSRRRSPVPESPEQTPRPPPLGGPLRCGLECAQTLRPPGGEVETANDQGRSGPRRGFLELRAFESTTKAAWHHAAPPSVPWPVEQLRRLILSIYDRMLVLDLEHLAIDGRTTRAPCGDEEAPGQAQRDAECNGERATPKCLDRSEPAARRHRPCQRDAQLPAQRQAAYPVASGHACRPGRHCCRNRSRGPSRAWPCLGRELPWPGSRTRR